MSYLEGLNSRQKEAVEHLSGPLLIVAGAGAGKTKTITHRIAHLIETGVPVRQILAVTFTNKAASEMRERVYGLIPREAGTPLVTTFHSLGVRLLREFASEAGLPRTFNIWDRDDSTRVVKRALETLGIESIQPRAIISAISRQKGNGVSREAYEKEVRSFNERTVANVWRLYEEALSDEGALDFDDLLFRALQLLRESPRVLSLLQNRWTHITVDEYQDTNASQFEIVRLLAGEHKNICVVGDGDQNIYSWRGADMSYLLDFEAYFPGARVILLEQNYRSTRTILTAANNVISKNRKRREKNLFTENETGEPINMFEARNEVDESWFIAQTALSLIEIGMPPSEIAVLYRENFQSRTLEEALLSFGVPYRVLGTRFFDRKEVKDTLSYLRVALNPKSKSDLARIASVPARGIGKVTLEKMIAEEDEKLTGATAAKITTFRKQLAVIGEAIRTVPASEAVRAAFEVSGMEAMYEKEAQAGESEAAERIANVRELVNVAVRYDDLPAPEGIERLLEEAALQGEQDTLDKEQPALSLMTVHASKGLEFDAVFITGLEQGLFPSQRQSDTVRDEEEERRLFYVALTRARTRLFLSFAHERMKYGSREYALPSEFLRDIDERLVEGATTRSMIREGLID